MIVVGSFAQRIQARCQPDRDWRALPDEERNAWIAIAMAVQQTVAASVDRGDVILAALDGFNARGSDRVNHRHAMQIADALENALQQIFTTDEKG